jgi:hypothetical protein
MAENTSTAAPAAIQSIDAPSTPEASQAPEVSSDASSNISPISGVKTPAQKSEAKKQEAARIKKLKLKIDGQEYEESVNLDDDDYLTRNLQKAKAFDKHSQEHATLKKEVNSFLEQLRKNPRKVLSDPNIGVDVKQLAASIIEEEIANSKKSPEQLEKEALEQQLKDIQDERAREKEEYNAREFERLQSQEYERYDNQISKALETSDLPKSPYVIKKMAEYMLMGLQNGMDVSPNDVLPLVREEMTSDLKEMFRVMPDEVIEQIVGKDVFTRIRKKSVAKAKSGGAPVPSAAAKPVDSGNKGKDSGKKVPDKKLNYKQFFGV